jgi:hypothetical protein
MTRYTVVGCPATCWSYEPHATRGIRPLAEKLFRTVSRPMTEVPNDAPRSAAESQPAPVAADGMGVEAPPSAEILKAAYKAFKKRLKLTQLDDASRIGHGPMSSGLKSTISGITPPDQYPRRVWEELVKQGKLKHAGHGMYAPAQ